MTYSNEELKTLWANDKKRRAFVELYKDWGLYSTAPELNLTFYKYDLPDGVIIIVMEHMQENYHPRPGEPKWHTRTKAYLQKSEYFMPDSVSEYTVSDYLKELKKALVEKKQSNDA